MASSHKYWYSYVVRSMRRYPKKLLEDDTLQSNIAYIAITKTIEDTKSRIDGEERLKLIDLLYFKQTHTFNGALMILSISSATAQRWIRDFVYTSARHMGLTNEESKPKR